MAATFWTELFIRSGALLLCGFVLLLFARRGSAAFRHRLILGLFGLLALLPILCLLLPVFQIPLWSHANGDNSQVFSQQVSRIGTGAAVGGQFNWPLSIWLSGLGLTLAPLLAGAVSASRIARNGKPLGTPALLDALGHLCPSNQRTPPILMADAVSVPLTVGLWRPRILLPASASEWDSLRLQAALAHEFAHLRRLDVAVQILTHLISALWWFQPLTWILRRRLRSESELACDVEAVRAGLKPSVYAEQLLAIAKLARSDPRLSSVAIGMSRPNDLEARLQAVLVSPCYSVNGFRNYSLVLLLGCFAMAASAITLQPHRDSHYQGGSIVKNTILSVLMSSIGLSAATVSGSVSGPSGEAISDARVAVYNPDTGAKKEIVTGADGKFSLAGAGPGQYILRIGKPGFNSVFRAFDLKANSEMNRQITMTEGPGIQTVDQAVNTSDDQSRPVRIGGSIAQGNLVTKVNPTYPVAAKTARVQGTVEIEIDITKDGIPSDLRVVSSPSDDLSQSALEAVRQWRYRPTLLNGAPVAVVSTVIVNYTLTQ